MCIRDFRIGNEWKVIMNSGSRGCQLKYWKDQHWFKAGSFDLQFRQVEHKFKIDYDKLLPEIERMSAGRCRDAALLLLNQYEKIFRGK